jgi:hypothetical protein
MDLICYVYEGWAPRIRPASPKRDWMEASPERFAYRCLPLAIANAHGWEVLSPCGFEARWTGGAGTEAVEIRLDPGADPAHAPVSLFGQAVLTFHVEGLIRTSEGWNLWVGGSPNAAKDGIAPLGGVIETDWAPYTFTMNWRFTRANQWIRFEENEPFCFFFPVRRGLLEGIAPRLRPIAEAGALMAANRTWSRSRDSFQLWVEETKPRAPADKWQKFYYRGVGPEGEPGPADHVSKLRLEPFRDADGKALEPPPAVPARRAMQAATTDLALRRAQWMLDLMERQRALSGWYRDIQRVRGISAEDFLDEFYAPARPVLIEGGMEDWPALRRWTPAYLRERIGPAIVEFQGGRGANPDFELEKDAHRQSAPFAAYLDLIEADSVNDFYLTAYNSAGNEGALAPLDDEIGPLPPFLTSDGRGMTWIGPAGTFTPLHFDLTNNLLAQISGRKRIALLPPSETRHLHHHRHVFSAVHDLWDEERLALYPSARQARRYELELAPGDMLYVPVGWWHQVSALEFSVMLTFTNFLWPNDASANFPADA